MSCTGRWKNFQIRYFNVSESESDFRLSEPTSNLGPFNMFKWIIFITRSKNIFFCTFLFLCYDMYQYTSGNYAIEKTVKNKILKSFLDVSRACSDARILVSDSDSESSKLIWRMYCGHISLSKLRNINVFLHRLFIFKSTIHRNLLKSLSMSLRIHFPYGYC